MNFPFSLSIQYADNRLQNLLSRARLRRWVQAALFAPAELTLRFVDASESQLLNKTYRHKDYATNVLTFAYNDADRDENEDNSTLFLNEVIQADIVLCVDVLQQEAAAQKKSLPDHAAHLVIHGVLHAQGYDHETDEEALEMEKIEAAILSRFKIANPYN